MLVVTRMPRPSGDDLWLKTGFSGEEDGADRVQVNLPTEKAISIDESSGALSILSFFSLDG